METLIKRFTYTYSTVLSEMLKDDIKVENKEVLKLSYQTEYQEKTPKHRYIFFTLEVKKDKEIIGNINVQMDLSLFHYLFLKEIGFKNKTLKKDYKTPTDLEVKVVSKWIEYVFIPYLEEILGFEMDLKNSDTHPFYANITNWNHHVYLIENSVETKEENTELSLVIPEEIYCELGEKFNDSPRN